MPRLWGSAGGQRVLVVATHPDDEVASCGGAILAHLDAGDEVRVGVATDGRRSRAFGLAPEEMARERRAEATEASDRLGVALEWIGLPEGEWAGDELAFRLLRLLRDFQPHLVYAPSRIDFHPEHVAVARALASALSESGGTSPGTPSGALSESGGTSPGTPSGALSESGGTPSNALSESGGTPSNALSESGGTPSNALSESGGTPSVRVYASQVPLTPVLTNRVLPVDPSRSELLHAMTAYRTQLGSIERSLRHRRYVGRWYGLRGAEELWSLSREQYCRLHGGLPEGPAAGPFRGLRYYAWSDPLAYVRGLGERRRLARLATS